MALLLFQLLNGFVWGWVVALMALGLSLVYGVLRIINVAHGAFYMLGAVGGYVLIEALSTWAAPYSVKFALALLVAPLLVGLLGALVEGTLLRPIAHRPVLTVIATFALLLIFQQGAQLVLPGVRTIAKPLVGGVPIFGLRYPAYHLALAGLSIVLTLAVALFLYKTRFGVWARAVRQDRELALALGIPVPWVYSLTFGLGMGLAAAAGVLAAPIVAVEAAMGMDILIEAFMVVIVGGLGSLRGAVIAALLLRLVEGLLAVWTEPIAARALALLLMGALLLWRPQGLLGAPELAEEE
jgi:branched-chain amino acid transport system permease protein